MNKARFLKALRSSLARLKKDELRRTLEYYAELIDDRVDAGESEADVIASLGSTEKISYQILADAAEEGNLRPTARPLNTVLLIIGSPLWLSLALAAFVVILAIFVSVWSVVISFIATDFALVVSGIALIVGGSLSGNLNSALFIIGCGCVSTAIGIALFYPIKLLTELCVRLVKWSALALGKTVRGFFKREVM